MSDFVKALLDQVLSYFLSRIWVLCSWIMTNIEKWEISTIPDDAKRLYLEKMQANQVASRKFLEGIEKLYPGTVRKS